MSESLGRILVKRIVSIFIFSFIGYAAAPTFVAMAAPTEQPKVRVHVFGNAKTPASSAEYDVLKKPHPAIDSIERDRFFGDVGLTEHIGAFDELDKNVLYLRLRDLQSSDVRRLYPKIPAQVIDRAIALLRKR